MRCRLYTASRLFQWLTTTKRRSQRSSFPDVPRKSRQRPNRPLLDVSAHMFQIRDSSSASRPHAATQHKEDSTLCPSVFVCVCLHDRFFLPFLHISFSVLPSLSLTLSHSLSLSSDTLACEVQVHCGTRTVQLFCSVLWLTRSNRTRQRFLRVVPPSPVTYDGSLPTCSSFSSASPVDCYLFGLRVRATLV